MQSATAAIFGLSMNELRPIRDSLQKRAKAKSAQEKKKRKSIKDIERIQGEAAGDGGEADWEKAGEEREAIIDSDFFLSLFFCDELVCLSSLLR